MTANNTSPRGLTPFDVAVGWPLGYVTEHDRPRSARFQASPVEALEAAVLAGLERPPCLVTFSGGRDSSAVLAVATRLAEREGLDPPIPATRVFRGHPTADESDWQELVVRHLGVREWIRLPFGRDDLDLVGPIAARSMRARGLLWPAPVHGNLPVFQAAAGGSVLTGQGGDEIFGVRRTTPLRWIVRGGRSRRRALVNLPDTVGPAWSRRWALRRSADGRHHLPWLRRAAAELFAAQMVEEQLTEPFDWLPATQRLLRRRAWLLALDSMQRLADPFDVQVFHPLVSADFVASLAPLAGRLGFRSRTGAMTAVFEGLLPPEVLRRTSKARFNTVAVARHGRDFAQRWDGDGVDTELVDPVALRKEWLRPEPHAGSFMLLQVAWRATRLVPNSE